LARKRRVGSLRVSDCFDVPYPQFPKAGRAGNGDPRRAAKN
jgi:hypothetical protein